MPRYVLSLGSSEKHGPKRLAEGINRLAMGHSLRVVAISPVYRNLSVGIRYPRFCFNSCVAITTHLSPDALLLTTKGIESALGRIRTCRNGPRSIDIDIIYSPDLTVKKAHLAIPHAALWSRDFFLVPLFNVLEQSDWPNSLTLSKRTYMIKSAQRFLTRSTY